MNGFQLQQSEAARRREQLRSVQEDLYLKRSGLHHKVQEAEAAQRLGSEAEGALRAIQEEIKVLRGKIRQDEGSLAAAKVDLHTHLQAFPGLSQPQVAVQNFDDAIPFLLLPVRIETRFMSNGSGKALWVRIFPDDVAVHTHEKSLTQEEVDLGRDYWIGLFHARSISGETERTTREKAVWRDLAGGLGGTRAAWVAAQTEPESLAVASEEDLVFPTFEPDTLKADAWSRAPRTNVLPDRFVVIAFSGGESVHEEVGNLIPNPLILGPEPSHPDEDLKQVDGDLKVAEDLEWIYDFQKAVQKGMGVIIPLNEPFDTQGFDRLLVLGLRLSSGPNESRQLVEELIDNHHFSPDGMAIIPQGTATNNTDPDGSGFGSVDDGEEESFAVETGDPNFAVTDDPFDKSDGQRLVEALGIEKDPLLFVAGSGQTDVKEALAMNKALWPATLGYFLEEMLALEGSRLQRTRQFFTQYVTGRGPLPAVRIGTQPYGVLLTSDLSRWKWDRATAGDDLPFLEKLLTILRKVEAEWRKLVSKVAHVDAGGDEYQNLLTMLGLHATSVEFHRRHAVGKEFVWNYLVFNFLNSVLQAVRSFMSQAAERIVEDLGLTELRDPDGRLHNRIFDLAFLWGQDPVTDPLVGDVGSLEEEKWSETEGLPGRYRVPDASDTAGFKLRDYIGWLIGSDIDDIKRHAFRNETDESVAMPKPVLYRLLHRALLLAYHDATMNIYVARELVPLAARREVELTNVQATRTVTRWEFMEADVKEVAPDLSETSMPMVRFLQTPAGLALGESGHLREVRECLGELEGLPTARLERLFAEHVDLCSYRLDAWQTALFARRLEALRYPGGRHSSFDERVKGVHLGAYGWLENVRPGADPVPVNLAEVPESLREPDKGPIVEQPNNGGFIQGPSINHAVAAAVLRNAYLTHADSSDASKMSVNLSSERVRTALAFLEGIRNGQELGALLGYQFERGLHDRHDDPSLNQYILSFRTAYPLVADKITADEDGEPIETKEARNVFDGYALLEKAFLNEPRLAYPYDVPGLPGANGAHGRAIREEVDRMAASFDAIADLATAEGVYQVTQGNYDRAGAMLKAFTEGNNPPDPEIARTPRSGTTISNRVTLHVEPGGAATSWPGSSTPRSRTEPGLNRWLGEIIGPPGRMRYMVTHTAPAEATEENNLSLESLGVQPIDLVLLIGDDLTGETTELENRIAYAFREAKESDGIDDVGDITIQFMERGASWAVEDVTVFETLPLLRSLRTLITGCRPLSAADYQLGGELDTDPATNPKGYNELELKTRVEDRIDELQSLDTPLQNAITATVDESGDEPVFKPGAGDAAWGTLRQRLREVSLFGMPDAFPLDAVGTSDEAKQMLAEQAVRARAAKDDAIADAIALKDFAGMDVAAMTVEDKVEAHRQAARRLLGSAFNALPNVALPNSTELEAAVLFRDAAPPNGLTRHADNPLIAEEWLQGAARVREKLDAWEEVRTYSEALQDRTLEVKPLQLPFRETDHWVAVEYPEVKPEDRDMPEVFVPQGEFLSLVQHPIAAGFDPTAVQRGFVIDEWTEVIPNRSETTGIAVHYNQPGSEPPQTLLLAVTPESTGSWHWDDLVGTLNDTLNRAKQRAVEPDHFGITGYGHLLPAVLTAVTTFPWATISTDLVYLTAVHALENAETDD